MDTQTAIVLIVGMIIVAMVISAIIKNRRSGALKERFGPEYDHEVRERGRGRAEKELDRRAKRVEKLSIHPLPASDRDHFAQMWRAEQARFVDDPKAAVHEADRLVEEVMRRRGYPMGDFEQRSADISVDHPRVVENYRAAHDIALRVERGKAATEDLRQAMIHFRTLFEDLLDDGMSPAPVRG